MLSCIHLRLQKPVEVVCRTHPLPLMQAGASAQARQAIAAQVAGWERSSLHNKIDPELLTIYRLLAGDATPLTAALSLDWRRAFALHLW